MKILPKVFLISFFIFATSLFFKVGIVSAGCNALGCTADGDCDSGGNLCGSDPGSCANNCSQACTDPSDPTKKIPGTASITGTSCNVCDYDISCSSCSCGGGGSGGGGGSNMNGVVNDSVSGNRWVETTLSCNQSYTGVVVKGVDKLGNEIAQGDFTCNLECQNCDGAGHFDMAGVVNANTEVFLTLTIPASISYDCASVTWSITDRVDLSIGSDDVIINTGVGCMASFMSDVNPYNWRYGALFTMNAQPIDNNPPTKPGTPVVPACLAIGGSSANITFTGSTDSGSGMSHYIVNIDEGNNGSVDTSDRLNFPSTSYSYSFSDSKTYRIWIDAFDMLGNKNWSDELIYNPKTLPPAPTTVRATDGLDSKIDISWNDNSNFTYNTEDRFDVIRGGVVIHPIPTSNVTRNATSYSDTGAVCDGNNRDYYVKAVNSCGESLGGPNAGYCTSPSANSWWQVFNGGVHSNGAIDIDDIPATESVIGDGLTISTYNGYGLMSSRSSIGITSGMQV